MDDNATQVAEPVEGEVLPLAKPQLTVTKMSEWNSALRVLEENEVESVWKIVTRRMEGMPWKGIRQLMGVEFVSLRAWVYETPERARLYEEMLKEYADDLAFETVQIADEGDPEFAAHTGWRIKARQWKAERLNREMWGAKVEHSGRVDGTINLTFNKLDSGVL